MVAGIIQHENRLLPPVLAETIQVTNQLHNEEKKCVAIVLPLVQCKVEFSFTGNGSYNATRDESPCFIEENPLMLLSPGHLPVVSGVEGALINVYDVDSC